MNPNTAYAHYPGPGDFLPEEDYNEDVYETSDIDQLQSMLSCCHLDGDDLEYVPPWKRLRWSIALDYRAKLIRNRLAQLTGEPA